MSRAATAIPAIRESVTVDAPPADAFAAFTEGLNAWWPREYTWSGEMAERVAMEARPGGFLHEIGPHGMRLDWGRVTDWQPPSRIAFAWQVRADRSPETNPSHASQVEVSFEPAPGGRARVTVSHAGWERHGAAGAGYRDRFATAGAWPEMLRRYAAVVAPREEAPWTGLST